jgi:UDPglucose 6-dehydrogenase
VGANVDAIRAGIGSDKRIGKYFLQAGAGFGGSCFPKDVRALQQTSKEHGYDFPILEAVQTVNDRQRRLLVKKVRAHFDGELQGKRLAVWGLAFKPDTDDIREAPALYIIRELLEAGANVTAYDPVAMANVAKQAVEGLKLADSAFEAASEAEALLIVTEWDEFKDADLEKLGSVMGEKVIFDGRNIYELGRMREQGFHYNSIGRPVVTREGVTNAK